ncbi:hypothetical protein HPB49_025739 [Dermacentor silvarum]|nr:hypothetical protein HPB49_025739 [Dermacentor silvarum]
MAAPRTDHERNFNLDSSRNLRYEQGEHLWPQINYAAICRYFVEKASHDGAAANAFRALDAYQYVKSGKVHDMKTAVPRPGLRILKGFVSPSQRSGLLYECWIAVTEEGEIEDTRLGRVCSHSAAVCFAVDFWTQVNTSHPAPTDLPCQWVQPRLKKIPSKPTKKISYQRHRYGPMPTVPKERGAVKLKGIPDVKGFLGRLQQVAPSARLFTLTTCQPGVVAAATVPEDATDPRNSFASTLEVTLEVPLSAYTARLLNSKGFRNENVGAMAAEVIEKFSITENEARRIESATRTQANNPLWHQHRKGRVTASIFKDVCRSKRVQCTTLLNKIFSTRPLNVPAVLYGVTNEPVAKERLLEHLQTMHSNARIEACGLMINPNYPLLGCSPDEIFRCDCHDPALVEVKCLFCLRDCSPEDLVAEGQKRKGFCLTANGTLKVIPTTTRCKLSFI